MDSSGLKEDIFYSSSWMQEILEISNIGLWLLEINKNNTDVRLYADDKMLELLGLQKSLSRKIIINILRKACLQKIWK